MGKSVCIWLRALCLVAAATAWPLGVAAQVYSYDSAGRLTSVTYDDGSQITYSYDASANPVGKAALAAGSIVVPGPGETTTLVAAVLPSGRSVQTGKTATAFATLINFGAVTGLGCSIAPETVVPASFFYQITDPATNAPTGNADTPATVAAGGVQSFVIGFTPTAAFAPTEVAFRFDCANSEPASSTVGLNTLLLSASDVPVPDIVALVATLDNDGIVKIPAVGETGIFSVATVNVGAGGTITVSADTGAASLPLVIAMCETNPMTGACISAIGATVTTEIAAGATPTFAFFVTASAAVAFDPAANRVFVRFDDGVQRGSTSVAVRTN